MKQFLNRVSRLVAAFFLLINFSIGQAEAKPFSEIEWSILQLEILGMRIQSVESDMRLCLDRDDFRADRKDGGAQSVKDLQKIAQGLKTMELAPEGEPFRQKLNVLITKLQDVYRGLHKKNDKQIGKEFEEFWSVVGDYNKAFFEFRKRQSEEPKAFSQASILIYEARFFKNEKDRTTFLRASKLMNIGKTLEAWKKFEILLRKYRGTDLEGGILTRSVQCMQSDQGKVLEHFRGRERDAGSLKKFLDQKRYSPSLYDIYPQWVVLEQGFNHGMSNMSEIPNEMYIDMRWQIIETIAAYLKQNPDDNWARIQTMILMDLPIIERDCGDGCQMGNSALLWMARYVL